MNIKAGTQGEVGLMDPGPITRVPRFYINSTILTSHCSAFAPVLLQLQVLRITANSKPHSLWSLLTLVLKIFASVSSRLRDWALMNGLEQIPPQTLRHSAGF